jgi:membrane associated rhomboid family serine protease
MVTTALALLLLAGFALYLMTPEERAQLAQTALTAIKQGAHAATHGAPSTEAFDDLLRTRTRWLIVTPLLIALNTLVFMFMVIGPGAFSDAPTLIAWGANFAPRTVNGEWWRLITSTFVHTGFLHFIATIAGLVPLGLVLERAVGRLNFALVYVAAGMSASVVSLWTTPSMSLSTGASGAIFGVYGLFAAALFWSVVGGPQVSVPVLTVRRVAAAAAVFLLYNLLTDDLRIASELAGFAAGTACGLLIAREVAREKPARQRAVLVTAPMLAVALISTIPLHQVDDVRPEIVRIAAVEERTAAAYDAAVAKFKHRHITADALADLIDRTIVVELHDARTRLKALPGVPDEQVALVAAAEKYFALREHSWRLRAEALLRLDTDSLREADRAERAALDAFEKMRSAA